MKTFLSIFTTILAFNSYGIIHHQLNVDLIPSQNFLKVNDAITFEKTDCQNGIKFSLHQGLNPKILSPRMGKLTLLSKETTSANGIEIENYKADLPCGETTLELQYAGTIYHPIVEPEDPYSRGTSDSPGLISLEGVVLSSSTNWYPIFDNGEMLNFDLNVSSSDNFTYMSQGKKINANSFQETTPQEEIYLIGAKFSLYENKNNPEVLISAYLRTPDDQMASSYLSATETYLNRYSNLIGAYPYTKFDLVENFWDTGFGMPSFTLLGSNIIRLPFIINTSYPHEVLHDWWGNSVYVDYNRGNWCEGITAYMADHLMSELSSNGDTYRRDTLQKFTDFVTPKTDFPLNKFLYRYNAPSEAIGYGKALMFFHMLRLKLGDQVFRNGFSHFYENNKFKKVSYTEIQKSLEAVSGKNLNLDFQQWVNRTGAPKITIAEAKNEFDQQKYKLMLTLEQTQNEDAFDIEIPLAITLEGQANALQTKVRMNKKIGHYEFEFPSRPQFIQVDPEFDVFRRLSSDEVPTVLTMVLGAKETYFILPSKTTQQEIDTYQNLIDLMKPALPKEGTVNVLKDDQSNGLPKNATVWVLGESNQFVSSVNALLKDQDSSIGAQKVLMANTEVNSTENSLLLTARDAKSNTIVNYVSLHSPSAATIFASKIIHYGKYSYLAFNGDKLVNKVKGVWKLNSSSMSVPVKQFDGKIETVRPAKLKMRGPLAN